MKTENVKVKLNFNELITLGFSLLYCNSRGISNETKDKIQNQAVSILWKECHHSLGFEFKGGDDFPKEADDLYNKLLKSLGSKWGVYDSWEETDQALVALIEGVKDGIKSNQLKLNYFTNILLNNYLSTSNDGDRFFNKIFDNEFEKRFSIIANINNALGGGVLYQEIDKILLDRYGEHKNTEQFQILLTWYNWDFTENDISNTKIKKINEIEKLLLSGIEDEDKRLLAEKLLSKESSLSDIEREVTIELSGDGNEFTQGYIDNKLFESIENIASQKNISIEHAWENGTYPFANNENAYEKLAMKDYHEYNELGHCYAPLIDELNLKLSIDGECVKENIMEVIDDSSFNNVSKKLGASLITKDNSKAVVTAVTDERGFYESFNFKIKGTWDWEKFKINIFCTDEVGLGIDFGDYFMGLQYDENIFDDMDYSTKGKSISVTIRNNESSSDEGQGVKVD